MARYIDLENPMVYLGGYTPDGHSVYHVPSNTPTADVVERKRGKWEERKVIEDGKVIEEWQSARCSVCGKFHTTPYMYYFDDFAYCPHCGARML